MEKLSRRRFLEIASAATFAAFTAPSFAASLIAAPGKQRVFIASGTPEGILAFDWNPATAELTAAGVAAQIPDVSWVTFSLDRRFLFCPSGVSVDGKQTGSVASFAVANGELKPLSRQNSAGPGTCHVAIDQTGRVLLAADYGGGSAASFLVTDGKLSPAVWSEQYTIHGPNTDRQEKAHAHFAAFSPDNRFAYINDLGGDCIHIYKLNPATAGLTAAGTYQSKAGAGPRTLHFHPNGHTAYSVNELDSTVDLLEWSKVAGGLRFVSQIDLLPAGYKGLTRACDTVLSKDGKFAYFVNRDINFLISYRVDFATGKLTMIGRTPCGGKTPRNFGLDPTENWMLVANQDSSLISIFRRNPVTGALAEEGKNFTAATPMCILFV